MSLRMNSKTLPKGWIEKKLGEICLIKHGFAFKSQFFTSEESDYVLLTPGSFYESGGYREQGEKTKYYIGKIPNGFILKKGDFLFAMTEQAPGLLGSPLIVPESNRFLHNQRLGLVQVFDGIDWHNDFFFHLFNTQEFRAAVQSSASGVKVRHTSPNKLGAISIRFPPTIVEQKAIADNLNEAFEGIDRAIANTEKNLTNASELFESYLNAIFTKKGKGWTEKKLGDIATFRNGLNFTKSSKGESIKIVGVKDFQNYFWIQEDQLDSVTIDAELKEIDILRKGDILTVRSNGNKELIGRCVLAGDLSQKTSHSGFTIRIRIESENIYPQFIVYSLKSRHIRKQLIESGGGISISSLNQQGLSSITISFPKFSEQKAIVANINEIATESQRLEAIYTQKITALNELKQSILQKAFTGELTADTPKTAKEEIAA
ncbi:restriction endonuclease subunit S [Desmonostoc muscorum LEGE 12446]|uniref:Restriction endonuclease subunit S n=1 Tax=Desmonostoc muscorum LEGE 12446 TaxID=1828758 RepID=A0A8J6ZJX2_DESMC|nr:restriction endonuclease subunit S [Desmonostoc muscorum]MCF2151093.1 restriction endonuclease subunit S [Desmonostoc muscorum LEGE 12446]